MAPDAGGDRFALRPSDLDRSYRQEQRSGKIALAANPGFRNRLLRREVCHPLAKLDRAERLDRDEIDGPGDGGLEPIGREAANPMDTGLAGRQPIQLSSLPLPSEVRTPNPVTTTGMWFPCVSPSPDRLNQGHAFAAPVP